MAQDEHDALDAKNQTTEDSASANAEKANEEETLADNESAEVSQIVVSVADTTSAEIEAETPVAEDEGMEKTETLSEMPDETPSAISGESVDEPALVDEAYEVVEAAAASELAPEAIETQELSEESPSDTESQHESMADSEEEDADEGDSGEEVDYSQLSKEELTAVLQKELEAISVATVAAGRFKKSDALIKEVRPVLDQLKQSEWNAAKEAYVADSGSEDGFEYKHEAGTKAIEDLIKEIRAKKNAFFQALEKNKDQNFNKKTELLQRLRELVDKDESHETDAADMKSSWEEFKKIQEEWKSAGNISSPHNGTLWATYNALIDRYFSNRNIYFELKELDRKRNSELKIELCEKVETLVGSLENRGMSREILQEANQIFEEYKHVGPAPREEQEQLWQRFKKSLDTLYDARRRQYEIQKKAMSEVYDKKSKIYETILPYTAFSSGSINEWNTKTKEIIAYQEEWVATKGPMPRDEGKELSKKFWIALKTFFQNKGEFFKQLESRREQNLKAKTELCEEVEKIVEAAEDTAANTQRVIELQKKWKMLGQVPEKFKDSIYLRFKKACDGYFEQKRSKNKDQEKEFEENLAQKKSLCDRIEKAAGTPKEASISQLNAFKSEWAGIGFVPRKDMQFIQKRYIAAVNAYVSAIGKLSTKEKEQVVLESEVELVKEGESNRGLFRKENDIRRKVTQLENDIALWQNNIEFFAKSKTSDKLKATFEEKINKASEQLEELKHQLAIIQEAI